MKGVYIFLANGFEEIEALATLDVLRRGGVDVKTVSVLYDKFVTGSHKTTVVADMTYGEFKAEVQLDGTDESDVMIFPGGMPGTRNLAENGEIINFMRLHYAEGGAVAAICAAPGLVVSQLPSLQGKHFTCFDGFEDAPVARGGIYEQKPAVRDGNLITGRGAGCAVEFGLAILAHLKGEEAAAAVRHSLML
ncbi:dJ-1 family protein [Bacteroides sp. CAG:545]|jgi:4-methyl-5(b-hydroxyethyl)-thiazole monophosphate biosynthesis|nr:DJ-1 family glyoxalase III [Bacteroidales bacterium]CCZ44277.1 dJ-1 family protein [Bacteroides sp. CAG:545]